MRVSHKVATGFGLMIVLLGVAAAAGWYALSRLSNSIDFLTGPAWDTADGGMESTILLQRQMIVVDRMLRGVESGNKLQDLIAGADKSLDRTLATGLVPADTARQTREGRDRFAADREKLLSAYAQFTKARRTLGDIEAEFFEVTEEAERIGDSAMEGLREHELAAAEIQQRWSDANSAMEARIVILSRAHLFDGVATGSRPVEQATPELAASLASLKEMVAKLAQSPEFGVPVAKGKKAGKPMREALQQLLGEYEAASQAALENYRVFAKAEQGYQASASALSEVLETMEAQADRAVEGEAEHIAGAKGSSRAAILSALLIGLLVAAVAVVVLVRAIAHPVAQAADRLREIAEGDGNLNVQLDARGDDEIAALATAFNVFVGKLRHTIAEVTDSTRQLSGAAEGLSRVADDTNATIQRERSETEQVAAAMEQMAATVQEVARNTVRAAQAAHEANDFAASGRQVVTRSITAINALAGEIERAAGVVEQLEQRSAGITAIMDVIRGIAEQTNLLALNAAIEAARAGDQGRGFAVVADEVRTLASRTHQSTQEIDAMLKQLQSDADAAVAAMKGSREQAAGSVRSVTEAGAALEQIAGSVGVISDMNAQIASAAEQQSSVAEEMSRNLTTMSSLSERTADGSQQTAAASRQLSALAGQLQRLVGQFRT